MITMNNATGRPLAAFGGGAQYGAATGRTANFGYENLAAGGAARMAKGGGKGGGGAARMATPQLNATGPIGIPDAPTPTKQEGGGGLRMPNFTKGMGEGVPEAGAAAGGEAAAGGGAELADLAVLAL